MTSSPDTVAAPGEISEIEPVPEAPETAGASFKIKLFNSFLRLLPMAAKFVLTLYMARFYPLYDMGVYGLVFSTVIILTTVLGQRLDFIITRDIVDVPPDVALQKMRDGAYFYGANYLLLALLIGGMIGLHIPDLSPHIMLYVLALSILENFGSVLCSNMVALNQQLLSNALFFLRAGVWIAPVIVLGEMDHRYRNYDTVLSGWSIGAAVSIVMTLWCWRGMPWRQVLPRPVDWKWLWQGVRKGSLFWLGMIGIIGGSYADRYIVGHFLALDIVAVLTLYSSFTNAILTLMQSGVIVFAYPRMIAMHRNGDARGFRKETWHTVRQMALGATAAVAITGVAVPMMLHYLGREAFLKHIETFWLLLIAIWLRVNAEIFFHVLFARHQDKPLWISNLLFLIPAVGGSMLLVPLVGFRGIGYSSILANLFLLLCRLWYARDLISFKHKP